MKKFLLPALAALLALPAMARDFTYTYEGQSLVYTVIDETAKTCMVKCGAPVTPAPDEKKGEPTGIYLRGDMNDWMAPEEWEFRTTDNADEYVITNCTIAAGANFKVADADWNVMYGSNGNEIQLDVPYILGGAESLNLVMPFDFAGDVQLNRRQTGWSYEYTILFVPESSKIIKGRLDIPGTASDGTNEYTVKYIAPYAFSGYTGMTSVLLPNTVVRIGAWAFSRCSALDYVWINESVEEIGDHAFYSCKAIGVIYIPASVKSIGEYAFLSSNNLAAINVDESNTWYSSADGVLVNKETGVLIKCPEGKMGDMVLPSSITGIGLGSVEFCEKLTSITVPNSVKEIPQGFAQHCEKLQTVSLPASIEKIGSFPFMECPAMYEINVEEGCKNYYSLDGVLFSNMDNNPSLIKFPVSKALYTYFPEGYNIPEGVKTIGEYAFYESFLNYVNIPSTVTVIGNYAFASGKLNSITIPSSVESIGKEAFYANSQLVSVSIPGSVKSFGDNVFGLCEALGNVYYNTTEPISYSEYDTPSATLYIRPEGVEAAKATAPWSDFMNIIPYDFDNINNKDYYLIGEINNWTNSMPEYKFTPAGNGEFVFDCDGILTEFKITDGTWDAAGVYGGDNLFSGHITVRMIESLIQPGTNLKFGDFTGVKNAHIVFNPSERTLVVTGDEVKISYTYEIWGNFPAGGDEWAAIGMRSDNNDGLWTAKNVVAENECQFLLRQMREDGKILFWGHSTDGALITEPGTYVVGWQDYNFSIAPGTWDLMYDERTGMLTVSAASGSVDGIEADDNVAPVYYNLQGVRVDNPASGLYIVVRGSKTTKEYIK